jgi:hypothetical protein
MLGSEDVDLITIVGCALSQFWAAIVKFVGSEIVLLKLSR